MAISPEKPRFAGDFGGFSRTEIAAAIDSAERCAVLEFVLTAFKKL
jgi:hypothetical protein